MDENLEDILGHMPEIDGYEKQLCALDDAWESIKLITEVSCPSEAKTILPSMISTQRGFQDLQKKLVENLVSESLKKQTRELASRAQVAVDILIRNLFERTADVGFLATDADIRNFLSADSGDVSGEHFIKQRLVEYVKKYTVYEEIVILDTDLKVRAHLDETNPISNLTIDDLVVTGALASHEPYVESFGKCRIQPRRSRSLTYACKITQPHSAGSASLGVLVLCFRFENELEGIFRKLTVPGNAAVISILNDRREVIASSDPFHLPLGARLPEMKGEAHEIIDFRGIEYIAKICTTTGYQGYFGLGWLGAAMVPVGLAFQRRRSGKKDNNANTKLLDEVISQSNSLSSSLSDIASNADSINLSLRRVVWNGQVMSVGDAGDSHATVGDKKYNDANYEKLRALLNQIRRLGIKTSKLFGESISNLYQTVLSSYLNDVQFYASLAIDIMDRNLYERADDCRWWALTSDFRAILRLPQCRDADRNRITDILSYINGLYTVYTCIFVYDKHGVVVAVSNNQFNNLIGEKLEEEWVARTLNVRDSQKYCVSSFETSRLYEERHTYIYAAAISALDSGHPVVGGIGLVFDSEPQFEAMLRDSLPSSEGCFALYVERDQTIISSSSKEFAVGSKVDLSHDLVSLPCGRGMSQIVVFQGSYWAVGSMTSSGYREYKNTGDYRNDVIALVFVKLGSVDGAQVKKSSVRKDVGNEYIHKSVSGEITKLATFFMGEQRYAVVADCILEAVGCDGLTRPPDAPDSVDGLLKFHDRIICVINLAKVLGLPVTPNNALSQVIVFSHKGEVFGLLVDDLDSVVEVDRTLIERRDDESNPHAKFVQAVVNLEDLNSTSLVVVLDPFSILGSVTRARGEC